MSMQLTRPMDALQRIMNSFKHFEKKLDKLQDDVNYHGHTLSELRVMVTNLSGGNILNPDNKGEDAKYPILKKTAAIQYEDINLRDPYKMRRKNAVQPLPNTLKVKRLQGPKYGSKVSNMNGPFRMNEVSPNSKGVAVKHALRHRKAVTQRKSMTFRSQKVDKKRSKVCK